MTARICFRSIRLIFSIVRSIVYGYFEVDVERPSVLGRVLSVQCRLICVDVLQVGFDIHTNIHSYTKDIDAGVCRQNLAIKQR